MSALRSGARRPVSPPPKPRSAWRRGQRRPSSTASPSMTSPPPICSSGQAQPPIGPMTSMLRSGGSRQPSCEREQRATSTHGGMRRSERGGLGSPAAEPRSGTFHRSTVSRSSCVKHQTRRRVSEHSLWCCCPKRQRRASIGSHQLNSSTTRNSWLPTPTTSHSAPCWMAHRVCFTSLAGGYSQRRSASTRRGERPSLGRAVGRLVGAHPARTRAPRRKRTGCCRRAGAVKRAEGGCCRGLGGVRLGPIGADPRRRRYRSARRRRSAGRSGGARHAAVRLLLRRSLHVSAPGMQPCSTR